MNSASGTSSHGLCKLKRELFVLANEGDVSGIWSVSKLRLLGPAAKACRDRGLRNSTSGHPSCMLWPASPSTKVKTSLISGGLILPSQE